MKKLLVSFVLATSALVATAPASAQYEGARHGYGQRGQDVQVRLNRIENQISRGVERGRITPREARRLHGESRRIWSQARQFQRSGHGLDYRERAILDRRIDRLQAQVRYERRDDDRNWRRH